MSKRAILYARVSTDDQSEKGYSLPSQFDAMRKYAAREGFDVVGEFQDDYSGATPIEFRPEGAKAYTMLKSGDADLIIAYSIDRYVRPPEDGDEWDMPILIRGLAKLGKEIHTVRRGKLNTNFADLLIALLDARKAGEERRDIRERTMRGKRAKVKQGKVIGMHAPFGYRHIRDEHGKAITFEVIEEEARIVRLIFKWYVDGDEHGERLSAKAIARRLSEMHVLTPGENHAYKQRKRKSCMWGHSTIGRILTIEVYAGTWRYGVRIPARADFTEAVSVNIPAIIDRETWERAQAQRVYNSKMSKRNCRRDYLLRGVIRCGCGGAMCGAAKKLSRGDYTSYACIWRVNHHSKLEDRPCKEKSVRADAIEADVWDEIRELFQDPDRLWDDLKAAQQNADDQLKPMREKLQITDDLIKRFQGEAGKIAAALPDTEKGGAVHKAMKEKEKEVNARLDELTKQREKIVKELEAGRVTDERIETIMTIARKVKQGIDRATPKGKRRILEALDVQVTVGEGKYHVKCIVGEKDGEIRKLPRANSVGIATASSSSSGYNWHILPGAIDALVRAVLADLPDEPTATPTEAASAAVFASAAL